MLWFIFHLPVIATVYVVITTILGILWLIQEPWGFHFAQLRKELGRARATTAFLESQLWGAITDQAIIVTPRGAVYFTLGEVGLVVLGGAALWVCFFISPPS